MSTRMDEDDWTHTLAVSAVQRGSTRPAPLPSAGQIAPKI